MDRSIIHLGLLRRIRYWEKEIADWKRGITDFEIDTDDISDEFTINLPAGQMAKYSELCRVMATRYKTSVLAFHWAVQDFLADNAGSVDVTTLLDP